MGLFADDISLWHRVASTGIEVQRRAFARFVGALGVVESWCDRWGVRLAPAKCQAIVFRHKARRRALFLPTLRIGGRLVEWRRAVKYLGIWFDAGLTWGVQRRYIIGKVRRSAGLLRYMVRKRDLELDFPAATQLYTALVGSQIRFGSAVWGGDGQTRSMLASVQGQFTRALFGAFTGTRNAVTEAVAQIAPVPLVLDYQVARMYIRAEILAEDSPEHNLAQAFKVHAETPGAMDARHGSPLTRGRGCSNVVGSGVRTLTGRSWSRQVKNPFRGWEGRELRSSGPADALSRIRLV